jgi:hypothetical protein
MRVIARANRYLDRAGLRHRCSRDHPVAMRAIARAKVVQENNALTHDRDNQGYNHGYRCAASVHVRYFCYVTAAQVVCIAAFDDQLAITMSGGAASVGTVKAGRHGFRCGYTIQTNLCVHVGELDRRDVHWGAGRNAG